MKYIKKFETIEDEDTYIFGQTSNYKSEYNDVHVTIGSIMTYLKADIDIISQQQLGSEGLKIESKYNVDVVNFLKEIFLKKKVGFQSLNKIENDPHIRGIVKDVDFFAYKDDVYVKVKIKKDWALFKQHNLITVDSYDAYKKPLHKLVKLKKEAEKYNIL